MNIHEIFNEAKKCDLRSCKFDDNSIKIWNETGVINNEVLEKLSNLHLLIDVFPKIDIRLFLNSIKKETIEYNRIVNYACDILSEYDITELEYNFIDLVIIKVLLSGKQGNGVIPLDYNENNTILTGKSYNYDKIIKGSLKKDKTDVSTQQMNMGYFEIAKRYFNQDYTIDKYLDVIGKADAKTNRTDLLENIKDMVKVIDTLLNYKELNITSDIWSVNPVLYKDINDPNFASQEDNENKKLIPRIQKLKNTLETDDIFNYKGKKYTYSKLLTTIKNDLPKNNNYSLAKAAIAIGASVVLGYSLYKLTNYGERYDENKADILSLSKLIQACLERDSVNNFNYIIQRVELDLKSILLEIIDANKGYSFVSCLTGWGTQEDRKNFTKIVIESYGIALDRKSFVTATALFMYCTTLTMFYNFLIIAYKGRANSTLNNIFKCPIIKQHYSNLITQADKNADKTTVNFLVTVLNLPVNPKGYAIISEIFNDMPVEIRQNLIQSIANKNNENLKNNLLNLDITGIDNDILFHKLDKNSQFAKNLLSERYD
jgi:hypothetical protein